MTVKTSALLATFILALIPAIGWGATAADTALAEKTAMTYRQRAGQGDADAALRLGNMVSKGSVAALKFGEAVDWYQKGCTLGSLSACHNAGVSYEHGRNGAKRDYYEAATYYLQAAERAFLPSQINLAILHANGRVTSQDHREGLKWLLIAQRSAAQCADKPVCRSIIDDRYGHRQRLEAQLSERDRRETRDLAEAWQPVRR